MPTTDLLKTFGLSRNPFTDRTAEKTSIEGLSLYLHSDLRGFRPSETTYVFFGRRGAGKTTIRLQMMDAYRHHNEEAAAKGGSKGAFVVDICRPGHMTACLSSYQEAIGAAVENWDAVFSEQWRTSDLVDCILSYSATELVRRVTANNEEGKQMLDALREDEKGRRQFLLLAHLYARTDTATLAKIRGALVRPKYTATQVSAGVITGLSVLGSAIAASKNETVAGVVGDHVGWLYEKAEDSVPLLRQHPKLMAAGATGLVAAAGYGYLRYQRARAMERAAAIQRNVRVVKQLPTELLAGLLAGLFNPQDSVDTVRSLCIGISAHQKLDLLTALVRLLGFESVAVFGDCFDEVVLLDPVRFPAAMKAFAREVCRNDILNFGRLHFFFPDSRLALDLNTDRTLKEARFDRHFVRDLTWSRHQLEELAERRFRAAQAQLREEARAAKASGAQLGFKEEELPDVSNMTFVDLFKKVRGEDFSSYIGKLSTPRELLIMMTEMFSRIEANPEGGLTAQDMEIAVTKALEQSV